MPRRSHKNKKYSAELKLSAVLDYLGGSGTMKEICKKYGILSDILPANVRNIPCLTIKLHRMQFCCNFVWTIAFVCGIMFHEVIESFLFDFVVVTLF